MMVRGRYQQAVTQERKIVLQIKKLVEGGILEIEATGRWLQTTAELSPIFSSPHHLLAGAGHLRFICSPDFHPQAFIDIAKMSATTIEAYKMWIDGKEVAGDAEQSVSRSPTTKPAGH